MSKTAIDNSLIDCQQAASYLGVSLKTIRRWAQSGKLQGSKVGSRGDWRFTHVQLDQMVQASENEYDAIKQFLHKNAVVIGNQVSAKNAINKNNQFFVEIIEKLADNLTTNAPVKKDFNKLATIFAEASFDRELSLSETIAEINFLRQAVWEAMHEAQLLQRLTVANLYSLNQTFSRYNDIIVLKTASVYQRHFAQAKKALKQSEEMFVQQSLECEKLVKINQAKEEFIAIASHQLRTPATAVKQYVGILMTGFAGPLSENQQKYLETAYASNERQIKLINDLLKTAQIDAVTYILRRSSQNIATLLLETVAVLQPMFDQRRQTLVVNDLSEGVMTSVDPTEIDLVFSNLLENASKYSHPDSTITVTLNRGTKSVQLSVADEGVGINAEDQDKIFEKFTRINNELTDSIIGSGLGLYWVRHIVQTHGGSISVASNLGKGSIFTVTLPLL